MDEINEELAKIERISGIIDPEKTIHAQDGYISVPYVDTERSCYIAPSFALFIRLGQARKWLEKWCDERNLDIVMCYGFDDPGWDIDIRTRDEDEQVAYGKGQSLAEAYTLCIEEINEKEKIKEE